MMNLEFKNFNSFSHLFGQHHGLKGNTEKRHFLSQGNSFVLYRQTLSIWEQAFLYRGCMYPDYPALCIQ